MSELTTTARPYARAVFELANESGKLSEWSETLQFMAAVASNVDAKRLLDNPKLTKEAAGEILIQLCGEQVDEQGQNLAKLLAENYRIPALPEVSKLFEELKSEIEGKTEVQVTSAFEMSALSSISIGGTIAIAPIEIVMKSDTLFLLCSMARCSTLLHKS